MNHYPHHIGDFNNATRHLTLIEDAIYRRPGLAINQRAPTACRYR